jgi:hypothetical protein
MCACSLSRANPNLCRNGWKMSKATQKARPGSTRPRISEEEKQRGLRERVEAVIDEQYPERVIQLRRQEILLAFLGPADPAMKRRLPGKAQPREDALREWERRRSEAIQRAGYPLGPLLWDIHYGVTEQMHRWRIQLDCSHIREVMTRGKDQLPSVASWRLDTGEELGPGRYICREGECRREWPWREILTWDSRDGEFTIEPDPEEPPDWLTADSEMSPEDVRATWAKIRRTAPDVRATWTVTLACGHAGQTSTAMSWKPEDGTTRKRVPARSGARRMPTDEHTRKWVLDGCPEPRVDHECMVCSLARVITAYEYTGRLVPAPRKRPAPPSVAEQRATLGRRIWAAEREAGRLRKQLEELPGSE